MKIKSIFGPEYKEFEVGEVVKLATEKPLKLSCGSKISNFNLAYHTGTPITLTGNGSDQGGQILINKVTDLKSLFGKKPGTQNG